MEGDDVIPLQIVWRFHTPNNMPSLALVDVKLHWIHWILMGYIMYIMPQTVILLY